MTLPPASNASPPRAAGALGLWHGLVSAAMASLGFFAPFAPAGVALALAALVALAAMRPGHIWRTKPWRQPVMAVGLALFVYIAVHTLWITGLDRSALHTVNRYQELLLAPLLLALFAHEGSRRLFFRGLVAGAILLSLLHWAALLAPGLATMLASRRISAGLTLGVCAFLVLMRTRGKTRPWPAVGLAAFLALTVLLTVESRTGQLLLVALASHAAWLYGPSRWRWQAAVAAPLLLLILALGSGAMDERVKETLAGARPGGPAGALTSTGIRIEMARLGWDLAPRHAATGAGFANYASVHEQAAQARYAGDPHTRPYLQSSWIRSSNPHNEFLMQLIGGGVVALGLFVAWLGIALWQAARAQAPYGAMLAGTTLAFAIGSLFNSFLMDFVEGHFHMAVLAWLLANSHHGTSKGDGDAGVRRVLVIATRQIGDVLLTTPLIRAARTRWPKAHIAVLGFEGTLGMLRGNTDVNELITTPARLGGRGAVSLMRKLWRRYDLALVTDPGDRAHLMGWIAAPCRSGIVPATSSSNWWKKPLLDHAVISAGDLGATHVTAEKQALLLPWFGKGEAPVPQVVATAPANLPDHVQAQLLPGAVIVHAPSMWPYKQWPMAHFEVLVRALLAQGRQVVLTGSASERDRACIASLRHVGAAPQLLDLSGQLDFNQLAALFTQAALYIGPDTSVSHLAAASGIPVIALFGPTNPMRWAPWPARPEAQTLFDRSAMVQQQGNVTLLQGRLPCVPCGRAGCEDHRQSRSDCLVDITPERVLQEARRLLGEAPHPPG